MVGFDNKKYIKLQSKNIKEKIKQFDKLYLEFGGKLFDDFHASRVLPGFKQDAKLHLLKELKNDLEIIFCISACDIEKKKMRAEFGITYDSEVIRLINNLTNLGISINSVVITLYSGQLAADKFKKKLERNGVKTYIHTPTRGYPTNINVIVSEEGYGNNPYIETTKSLIIVTAPGPSNGKLGTCLSQLYHEHKKGINAGYAKFETFPVWNLPLKHPINIAYEAATADLKDINMIDSFHLEKYNILTVNYNRDLEVFPVVKNILNKITGYDIYSSPTDMGVNTIKNCITNNEIVEKSACKEIVRRYFQSLCDYKLGLVDEDVPNRIKFLMDELNIDENYLKVVNVAKQISIIKQKHIIALELPNGKIITGKQTDLLSPASSVIINAIKILTKIPDNVNLLSPAILEPILKIKTFNAPYSLSLQEVIIALSICSVTNPIIEMGLKKLQKLVNCEAHATYIIPSDDLLALKNLKINITSEPEFISNNLFYNN